MDKTTNNEVTAEENLFTAWDRMDTILARYWLYNRHKLKTLTGEERTQWREKFKSETHFLIKRYCDLEFYQYLNKRLDYTKDSHRKDGIVIRNHMKELARFILIDKLMEKNNKFATTNDIQSKNRTDWWKTERNNTKDANDLSDDHLHKMINDYPELFTTRNELRKRLGRRKYDNNRRIDDHRDRIIESQFTRRLKVPPGVFAAIVLEAMGDDFAPKAARDRMMFQFNLNAKLRIFDSIDRAKLLIFRQDVIEVLEDLGANPFIGIILNGEFYKSSVFNYFIQSLFLQVRVLAELRWFRDKSKSIQKSINFREPNYPKYYRRDAKRAVKLSFEWFNDPEVVFYLMNYSAFICGQYLHKVLPCVGLWLNQECLYQLNLTEESKANACYNIGIGYFETGHHRLMLSWLKKSISMFDKTGGHPGDQADAFGYIAEYWRLKDCKKYFNYRNSAEELAKSEILSKRRRAFHYLFLANCAVVWKDSKWEERLYELGLLLTGNDPTLEDFAMFFNQCLTDLAIDGQRGPESGPGRFTPPRDWIEEKGSQSFRSVMFDPDAGN